MLLELFFPTPFPTHVHSFTSEIVCCLVLPPWSMFGSGFYPVLVDGSSIFRRDFSILSICISPGVWLSLSSLSESVGLGNLFMTVTKDGSTGLLMLLALFSFAFMFCSRFVSILAY